MSEISYIIGNVDWSLLAEYVLGLSTVGWALHASTQVPRQHWPASTIQDLLANADGHNKRLIIRTWQSSDRALDEETWSETVEEIPMNIVTQLVCDPSEVPFAQFCLERRHGLWEQHGESTKRSVRVFDDLLEAGQNESPTDLQRWIRSQARCECSAKPLFAT